MFFKVKKGIHKEDDVVYKQGEVVESNLNLDVVFRNKFEKLPDNTPTAKTAQSPELPKPEEDKGVAPTKAAPESSDDLDDTKIDDGDGVEDLDDDEPVVIDTKKYGAEVTKKYPKAEEKRVRIFKKGTSYNVFDADDGEKLNVKKLDKSGVKKLLSSLKG